VDDDDRMGAFDAVMWGIEEDPILRSVIVAVVALEGAPHREGFRQRVERLTRVVPQLRQRVIGNPVSLVPPRWETVPDFDLDYHLRWVALPADENDMTGVLGIAERAAEQDFDRDRPLWEMTVVTGVETGDGASGSAIVVKLHHAITDGVGGMMLAATMFDLTPEGADLGPLPDAPEPKPSLDPLRRLSSGIDYQVAETRSALGDAWSGGMDAARRTLSDPVGSAASAAAFALSASRLLAPASTPMSPIMTERSLAVRCAIIELPLDGLKAAAHSVGGTLNDAFMAIVSRGVGRYHAELGTPVEAVRVNMPVNMRGVESAPVRGNSWVPARFALPITGETPRETMRALHPVLLAAREEPALPVSKVVYRLLSTLPNPVAAGIAGGLMKGTDVAATNVPGPPFPVYVAGARATCIVPFAPKGGASLNIGLMSYDGTAYLGLTIDPAAVTDPDLMVACVAEAAAEVVASAQSEPSTP